MPSKSKARHSDRLVVVSNRLPYNLPREASERLPKRNIGGLVNALEPVLSARDGIWTGWDGVSLPSANAVSSSIANPRSLRTASGIDLFGVPLSEREISRYYHGFSNRALWPLFHDRLPTSVFSPDDYAAYVRVNRRFAETYQSTTRSPFRIFLPPRTVSSVAVRLMWMTGVTQRRISLTADLMRRRSARMRAS